VRTLALASMCFFVMSAQLSASSIELSRTLLISGTGLQTRLTGRSFIEKGRLLKESKFIVKQHKGKLLKAVLIWSAETKRRLKASPPITIRMGKKSKTISAKYISWVQSAGWIYTAAADITTHMVAGEMVIAGLTAETLNPHNRDPYTLAGWALLEVYSSGSGEKGNVSLYLSPLALSPGEQHEAAFKMPAENSQLTHLGIVGGHGIAGNAAANLLDGVPLTGKRDWRGADGELWDVHFMAVRAKAKSPHTITFDPLLQWVFPLAIVTQGVSL